MTCEFSSILLTSRSTGPPAASVEASGFIWSISGTKVAAAPTAPTVAVAMKRKSRRVAFVSVRGHRLTRVSQCSPWFVLFGRSFWVICRVVLQLMSPRAGSSQSGGARVSAFAPQVSSMACFALWNGQYYARPVPIPGRNRAGRKQFAAPDGATRESEMRAKDNLRSAAEVLVDQLRIHGVQHVFCVPGESYLAVLDAFHDSDIAVTVCRQEAGASMMAEAIGKVTGRPGVCFVTRGPGATNAAHGIHIAQQDFEPAGHVRRPGCARHARARGLPGGRLSRGLRRHDQMDDRDRRSGAGAGNRVARLLHGRERPAGAGRRRHPRGHAGRAHCRCRRAALRAGRDLAGTGRDGEVRGASWRCESADHAARRQPLVAGRLRRASAASRENTRCRSRTTFRRGSLFDQTHPATPATSASGPIRNCSNASNPPTLWS